MKPPHEFLSEAKVYFIVELVGRFVFLQALYVSADTVPPPAAPSVI